MADRTIIDARGAFCPGPLMELIATLKLIEIGDEIEVLATDQGSSIDIPAWVEKVKHETISNTQEDDVWHIVVKKKK
ncbi:MAG: sulfurtransferase TusA family protein [Gammaproteobacteria bacterium]